MNSQFVEAFEVLKRGGICILPTDTAYGICCRIDDESAVKRLYSMKRRPENQPTSILVSSIEMAEKYITPLLDIVRRVMKNHWPGGLTIITHAKKNVLTPLVLSNKHTIGIRMPDHPDLLDIISELNVPILGPSANFSGQETPYAYEHLDPELIKQVDYVVKGEIKVKKASTIVDCTAKPFKIIRQGGVDLRL